MNLASYYSCLVSTPSLSFNSAMSMQNFHALRAMKGRTWRHSTISKSSNDECKMGQDLSVPTANL